MGAARHNIRIEQGADISIVLTITDDNGVAMNLTGYSVRGKIKKSVYDSTAFASWTAAITTPLSGEITISLTNTVTKTFPKMDLVYDIEIFTAGDAIVKRIMEGKLLVSPEVTN